MHEVVNMHSSWSATLFSWAYTAVVVLLWFWVVSGALFALRFLAYLLLEGNGRSTPLAAGSEIIQFPIDRFKRDSDRDPFQD